MNGSWETFSLVDGLAHPRVRNRLFWTGSEAALVGNGQSALYGATVDVATKHWRNGSFSRTSWRDQYCAVWTGDEVLIWGGASDLGQHSDGAAFSPSSNGWRTLPPAQLAARSAAMSVWTGAEMLVVGGGTDRGEYYSDGAAYSPKLNSWRGIPSLPGEARFAASSVWTGTEAIVWGGAVATGLTAEGAAYDPAADEWRTLPRAPLSGRMDCTALWTGSEVIVWGGTQRGEDGQQLSDGAAFDPVGRTWRELAAAPLRGRYSHIAVWTGKAMLVWGGATTIPGDAPPATLADGASFDPDSGSWDLLPEGPLAPRYQHSATWTGEEMIVCGGCCQDPGLGNSFVDAASFRPD